MTHFVAGLGTCGTITGGGRFLKSKNPDVKVLGVHPADGHDIPGVRSLRQLKLADFFSPEEYEGLTEINNDEAYGLCKRLNQEESIIAGPSSGMALAGALKMVPDEPGVVCVVIFPDNAFKYTSSFRKHWPELFPAAAPVPNPASDILNAVQRQAENSPDVISPAETVQLVRDGAVLLDVRTEKEYADGHIEEAINVPLGSLVEGPVEGLPEDRSRTLVTMCGVGKRSLSALLLLKAQGYERVKSSRGGMQLWNAEKRPLKIT